MSRCRPVPANLSDEAVRARAILNGGSSSEDLFDLGEKLKSQNRFGLARRIFKRARHEPGLSEKDATKRRQRQALCTYKDPDLPAAERFDWALRILESDAEGLATTLDQETLGLAGAVYKRKWTLDARKENLERALSYYMRGYLEGEEPAHPVSGPAHGPEQDRPPSRPETDYGYTGINAAFVLDQLAELEAAEAEASGRTSTIAAGRRARAEEIRRDLVEKLPPLLEAEEWLAGEWWFFATLAEASFGIEEYDAATEWIARGKEAPRKHYEQLKAKSREHEYPYHRYPDRKVPAWELRSTAEQLAALFRIHDARSVGAAASNAGGSAVVEGDGSGPARDRPSAAERFEGADAGKVLAALLGEHGGAGVRTAYLGKVGLALSGGGFRASLFHIGVLARLAELDVLRHVEVLSCVSGGSILGAHLYLELQRLLESKEDGEIDRRDYLDLVFRVHRSFLHGVQTNIRTRVAASVYHNLKLIFVPTYSRTKRAGELYEKHLYRKIEDGRGGGPRWMSDLYTRPRTADGPDRAFNPTTGNWSRRAKVPELILNATSLNTGHNWQFTAAYMGEPPATIDPRVDGNYRLRRVYYGEAPGRHQCVRLGHAVAASACVPGLFEPLTLAGLYTRRTAHAKEDGDPITVQLVDGGVHDNQGVVGLLERDCLVVLVSDASGQMGTVDHPSDSALGAPLRSSGISQTRVRAEQFDELVSRERSGLLRGLMFLHLKKGVPAKPLDTVKTQDPWREEDDPHGTDWGKLLTEYHVAKPLQDKLARVRTDLDSFSEVEAHALMLSGYLQTKHAWETEASLQGFPMVRTRRDGDPVWDFTALERLMKREGDTEDFEKQLDVAAQAAFKIWRLDPFLGVLWKVLLAAAVAGLGYFAYRHWDTTLLRVGDVAAFVVGLALTAVVGKRVMNALQVKSTLQRIAVGVGLAVAGWVAAGLHLAVFDPWFLRRGRTKRVVERAGGAGS